MQLCNDRCDLKHKSINKAQEFSVHIRAHVKSSSYTIIFQRLSYFAFSWFGGGLDNISKKINVEMFLVILGFNAKDFFYITYCVYEGKTLDEYSVIILYLFKHKKSQKRVTP